jgi:hypothetical protein
MPRTCPTCRQSMPAAAVRCQCGTVLPEAGDRRSDPEHPRCGVCNGGMALMDQQCPHCGAIGYPAMRSRKGRRSKGAGGEL